MMETTSMEMDALRIARLSLCTRVLAVLTLQRTFANLAAEMGPLTRTLRSAMMETTTISMDAPLVADLKCPQELRLLQQQIRLEILQSIIKAR
jgi:hypothetical protein